MSLLLLPKDILRLILRHLSSVVDAINLSCVCRKFRTQVLTCEVTAEKIWRRHYLKWATSNYKDTPPLQVVQARKLGVTSFKGVICGDTGVGKTTFMSRWRSYSEDKKYVATIGVEVTPFQIYTEEGILSLNVWDPAGPEKFGGLRDGYYIGSKFAFIMFDLTRRITFKDITHWYRDITRVCDDIPIVLIGNKLDLITSRKVTPLSATRLCKRKNIYYCEISAKANFNLKKPFELLVPDLLKKEFLFLEVLGNMLPKQCFLDRNLLEEYLEKQTETICEKKVSYHFLDAEEDEDKTLTTSIMQKIIKSCRASLTTPADPSLCLPGTLFVYNQAPEYFDDYLEKNVATSWSVRLKEAILPLLKGHRGSNVGVDGQYPHWFVVRGLEAKPFHDGLALSISVGEIEAIRAEFYSIIPPGSKFEEISQNIEYEKILSSCEGSWQAIHLLQEGVFHQKNCSIFKTTMEFLQKFGPLLLFSCSIGYAYFSRLAPGTHVLPHCGPCNLKLRCHIPIGIPEDGKCWIRVWNEKHTWDRNSVIVFDDSFEHEVLNESSEERVVLVVDIWHPGLLEEEINALRSFPL